MGPGTGRVKLPHRCKSQYAVIELERSQYHGQLPSAKYFWLGFHTSKSSLIILSSPSHPYSKLAPAR